VDLSSGQVELIGQLPNCVLRDPGKALDERVQYLYKHLAARIEASDYFACLLFVVCRRCH
jgi:hypothetical protein